jgi:2-phospho-L-lactate/phosphoenolpyruvate guanylyltransferase
LVVEPPFHIVIPFKHENAKSRLSSVLSPKERRLLAFSMLRDVLSAVLLHSWAAVLARPGLDIVEVGYDVEIVESELELNDALNSLIAEEARRGWRQDILIVMADLALLTEKDVVGILNCEGDVVLCPGRGGGTNMILIRSPAFRTCYQGLSFPRHLAFAREAGLEVTVFESFRAGCDIDEPEDLSEVLLHGQGETRLLLEKLNFRLLEDPRSGCMRDRK